MQTINYKAQTIQLPEGVMIAQGIHKYKRAIRHLHIIKAQFDEKHHVTQYRLTLSGKKSN
jgi:hypothetical protein